jgi:hypothetical protein
LKRLPNVPSIVLGGATYTPTTLAGLFQSHIDAAKKVESDQGQYKAAIASYRALSKIVHNALQGLREFVRQMFNSAPDALSDFGFAPRKVAKKSAVKKVVAVQKNRATRAARGTVGPKKKLSIEH